MNKKIISSLIFLFIYLFFKKKKHIFAKTKYVKQFKPNSKMKIYNYGKTKNCLICGSIDGNIDKFIKIVAGSLRNLKNYVVETHPKEIERQERLAKKKEEEERLFGNVDLGGIPHYIPRPTKLKRMPKMMNCGYNLTDTIVIVNGCNCFGERDLKYYHDKLTILNKVLADNNTHILFVRGNDDPKYFEDELINFSNVKTIQDYSVVKLSKFNCLCIGGYVSLDRAWKIEQEKRIGRKMYWENEKMQYNEDDIDKIIKDYNIACVVTTTCPSFAFPGMNAYKHSVWASKDKAIINDMTEERVVMDKLYNKLVENNKKPYIWTYSRFKNNNQSMINDILFQSLNPFQFLHFNNTASSFFKVDFTKMLKENNCIAESLNRKMKSAFTYSNPWDDDNINVADVGESMDEEQAEGEDEEFDADFIDEVLGGADENGRAVEVDELRTEAREAPAAWHPYVIDHDEVLRPTNDTVRDIREEIDRFTAEMIASTTITANNDNMIYYDPATLRAAMAEATRGAVATDDGEGHG